MPHALLIILKGMAGVAVPLAAFASGLATAGRLEHPSSWKVNVLMGRSLLAILLVVPLVAALLLAMFDLPETSRVGLMAAILAIGIGPPALLQRTKENDATLGYEMGLTVTLLLGSIVFLPLAFAIHRWIAGGTLHLEASAVAKVVFSRALLPLGLGALVARLFPERISPLAHGATKISSVLMLGVVVIAIVLAAKPIFALGASTWFAAACLSLAAIVAGDLIGGRCKRQERTVLVSFCTMRFPALALLIASATAHGPRLVPAVLLYTLVSAAMLLCYRIATRPRIGSNERSSRGHLAGRA